MSRYLWLALLALYSVPATASTIQVKPDPADADFKFTTESKGVVLKPDADSKTDFTVVLAGFASDDPNDPPHEPVEGLFVLKAGLSDEGEDPKFDIIVGLPYDRLRSDEIFSLTALVKDIKGSDGDVSDFLASVQSADRRDFSTLVRHFWVAKQIWEARKPLLDQNQHIPDTFDVSIAYWYVVLAREALEELTVTPPITAIEAANWLGGLAGMKRPDPDLFNSYSAPADIALGATKDLKYKARIQDIRVGNILKALDADFQKAGNTYEGTTCARVRETLRIIDSLSQAQWGNDMVTLRTRTLIYAAGCLTTEVDDIASGEVDRLESLKARGEGLMNALRGLKKSHQVTSFLQTLKDAFANAERRV